MQKRLEDDDWDFFNLDDLDFINEEESYDYQRELEKIPLEEIEKFLRRKKLQNIQKEI